MIAACLIVRDAVATIVRCLASVRPHVGGVFVFDTGSTDGTLELLDTAATAPGCPIVVERGDWRDDFAWARNRSFAMPPLEFTWLYWLDSDEVCVGGQNLRTLMRVGEGDGYQFAREYVRDEQGVVRLVDHQVALVRRSLGWSWRGAVNEYLDTDVDATVLRVPPQLVRVIHLRPSDGKSFSPEKLRRDVRLLEVQIERQRGEQGRATTYSLASLAVGLVGLGEPERAEQLYREGLAGDQPEQRGLLWTGLAVAIHKQGRTLEAYDVLKAALPEFDRWPVLHAALADCAGALGRWEDMHAHATRALALITAGESLADPSDPTYPIFDPILPEKARQLRDYAAAQRKNALAGGGR